MLNALRRLVGLERRDLTPDNAPALLAMEIGADPPGVMSPSRSMTLSAVYACVVLLSESIASLPLHVYRRVGDGGRERAVDHPAYRLLHDEPNEDMSAFDFWQAVMTQVLLLGNAYAQIIRTPAGDPSVLYLLPAGSVQLRRSENSILDYVHFSRGRSQVIQKRDMLHFRCHSHDGIEGVSVIRHAASSLGVALSAERLASKFFSSGGAPYGLLKVKHRLTQEQAAEAKRSFSAAISSDGARIGILQGGAEWVTVSVSPQEAQFIESRKFEINDIARWFRVPPHMIGDLERATFSNIEHQAQDFVTHTLRPWLVRFERELTRKLFSQRGDLEHFAEFSVDGMLRGDAASRAAYYASGRQWGWLSVNDVRRLENQSPVEGGDVYLQPVNMTGIGKGGANEQTDSDSGGRTGGT